MQRNIVRSRMNNQFGNLKHKMQNYEQVQHLKIEQNLTKINQQFCSQRQYLDNHSSYADWQIQNTNNINQVSQIDNISPYNKSQYPKQITQSDSKSIQSNSNDIAKNRMVKNLCKAVQILRKKMPGRSLQQIIIRLQQAAQLKRDLSNQGELLSDYMNQYNIVNNINVKQGEEQSYLKKQADQHSNCTVKKQICSVQNINYQKNLQSSKEMKQKTDNLSSSKPKADNRFQLFDKQINIDLFSFKKKASFQQTNYIYRPKEQQIIIQLQAKDTRKTKFVNIEEQTRYKFQKVIAEAFVTRGYGVGPCRKEIQAQNLDIIMKRDNYKKMSISLATLAFRRLESFLSIECQKKLKFIDRHQMQLISIIVLNCRLKLQPQHVSTMLKYVKACYGIEDVIIGEIESVKLYLTFQRYLYGKNVTMQFLERIGQIQHRKQIELSLFYLNNRHKRYQQRLITLRQRRIEKNMQILKNIEYSNKPINNKYKTVSVNMDKVKAQPHQNQNVQMSNSHEVQIKQLEQKQICAIFQTNFAKQFTKNGQVAQKSKKSKLNLQLLSQQSKFEYDVCQIQVEPSQSQYLSAQTQNYQQYYQDIWSSQAMFDNHFDVELQKLKIDSFEAFNDTQYYDELEEDYTDQLYDCQHPYQYKVDEELNV